MVGTRNIIVTLWWCDMYKMSKPSQRLAKRSQC